MHTPKKDQGMALVAVLILAIFFAGIIAIIATRSVSEGKNTQSYIQTVRATEAANAGIELGTTMLFGEGVEVPNAPGTTWDVLDSKTTLPNGTVVEDVRVSQSQTGLTFIIESDGSSAGLGKTAVTGGRLGGSLFTGFGYAVLANNINCIMCHASFDNVDRINNTDPNLYGTFDRIKIASLESLQIREDTADSYLAGSYYTRGSIKNKAGGLIPDLTGTGVKGREFDSEGKLLEDAFGDLNPHELELASTDIDSGLYNPNQYLYTDYPVNDEEQTDGDLPTEFPPAIPDSNSNKIVDGTEFADLKATKGSGTLSGGTAFGVAPGDTYIESNLPTTGNVAATNLNADGSFDGNVFLIGTESDPLVIDGTVFVDGDILIKGKVQGEGQVYASGNIYFIGDTTYDDASRDFGTASNGDSNLVAYAAGGTIQIGDYLSPRYVEVTETYRDRRGKIRTRTRTQQYDVTSPEALTDASIDTGGPEGSGESASFTTSELTLFNKIEYEKHQADPTYQPRYYQLRDGAPVYQYTHPTRDAGIGYDQYFTEIPASEIAASGAAVISLQPQAINGAGTPWVSELFLKKVWYEDELSRDVNGQPFQIDGLIYTNNAIFALARSNDKNKSRTYGQIKVRGGMVAADLGILAGGASNLTNSQKSVFGTSASGYGLGFVMHYDPRVARILGVQTEGDDQYTRNVRVYINL